MFYLTWKYGLSEISINFLPLLSLRRQMVIIEYRKTKTSFVGQRRWPNNLLCMPPTISSHLFVPSQRTKLSELGPQTSDFGCDFDPTPDRKLYKKSEVLGDFRTDFTWITMRNSEWKLKLSDRFF